MEAERARRSLHEFVKQAWTIVDPAYVFLDNWHIGAICEHLEAVARGEIQRLLINIPPGHAKSLLVSVIWPAWVWSWRPTWQAIFGAYAADLSTRDSKRCRTLIESDWYRTSFMEPGGWEFRHDSNRANDYSNTANGRRLSMSVDGKATGERGDCVVVDDPINATDIMSKAARDSVLTWWDKVMSSRLNNMAKGSRVIIMQRLHEEDLSGHVLDQGGYEHLRLPSEFNPKKKTITFHTVNGERKQLWEDPRTEPGELLFPALFSAEVLAQAKKDLGSDGYSGQHDQDPSPAEGNLFKRKWWRFWKPDGVAAESALRPDGCYEGPARPLPKLYYQLISLDAAFKGKSEKGKEKGSDYVVFQVWAVERADRYLLHQVRGRMTFTQTCDTFRALCKQFPLARKKIVEDAANGPAVIDTLASEIAGIVPVKPEGGKESRAAAAQPQIESGNVYLPEGAPWLSDFVDEFASFPKGKNDDQVDCATQALLELGANPAVAKAIGMANI